MNKYIYAFFMLLMFASHSHARTVVDARGIAVEVPNRPMRILVLSELDLDAAIALKKIPIGATNGRGQEKMPRYLGQAGQSIPSVGAFSAPILDKVIALQPDLILAGGLPDAELLNQLGRIAPTVATYQVGENWKLAFNRIAHVLNANAEAALFWKRYQQQLQQTQAKIMMSKTQQSSVSIVRWNPQGPAYMLKDAFASQVLMDLQLKRPIAQLQAGVGHSAPLSLEALTRIDGDWLFVGTLSAQGQANDALKSIQKNPAFQQLNAVKNKRLVVVDGSLWTGLGGPLAALAIIADIEHALGSR